MNLARFFRWKTVLVRQVLQQRFKLDVLFPELEGLTAFHAHGKDLLDHSFQFFQLALADFQIFTPLFGVVPRLEVQQGVIGRICHRHRRFELVGDVVGEVALHFLQAFLLEHGMDEKPEGEGEQKEKYQRGRDYPRHFTEYKAGEGLEREFVYVAWRYAVDVGVIPGSAGRLIAWGRNSGSRRAVA